MFRTARLPFALVLMLAAPLVGVAQEKSAPTVIMAQNGADELYKDLEFILSLTNKTEQKQWSVVKDYLDIFLIGIDTARPLRMDVILGGETERYRISLPVNKGDIRKFRDENLDTLGIESRKYSKTLYKLKGAFEGYMRYKNNYATIAEQRADIPKALPDPSKAIAPFLANGIDLAARGMNTLEGLDERRKQFQLDRSELIVALKPKKNESSDDFVLRKMLFGFQVDEAERLYVEAKELVLGWTTDIAKKRGSLDIDVSALKGTAFAASIKSIADQPSRFTNIERSKDPLLSLRFHHPVDEMRQKNLVEFLQHFQVRAKKNIDEDKTLTDDEKTNGKSIVDLIYELLAAPVKAGYADGFLEVHSNESNKKTLVGGFQSPAASTVADILKLLPKARKSQKIEMDVDQEGDVAIHKAFITVTKHADFLDFFGTDEVLLGGSKDVVWFASGENALAELKAVIKKAAEPIEVKPDGLFADVFIKLGPWIELRHKRDPKAGDVKLRNLALEAFKLGDDTLTLQLRRAAADRVVGQMIANTGILRFVGKIIADFSKENLDEE